MLRADGPTRARLSPRRVLAVALLCAAGEIARSNEYNATIIEGLGPVRIANNGRILGARGTPEGGTEVVIWSEGGVTVVATSGPESYFQPTDMNEDGVVVGIIFGPHHAFRWEQGVLRDLHPAGHPGDWSEAWGVNSDGDVVGMGPYVLANGGVTSGPLVWRGMTHSQLPYPDETSTRDTRALAFNSSNEIVGEAPIGPFGSLEPCIWLNGELLSLERGNAINGSAGLISDTTIIAGTLSLPDPDGIHFPHHAVLWEDYELSVVGSANSVIHGVNRLGEAVGEALENSPFAFTVLWRNGVEYPLENLVTLPPGWHLRSAIDINDNGEIVCYGENPEENRSGTLLLRPADADRDGLLDAWETQGGGIDVNGDGQIDLDLYARGARPDHKDLFIEVDAMAGRMPAFDTLLGGPNRVGVVQAFANAPVSNPDGTIGITLHIQMDFGGIALADWPIDWWTHFDALKATNFGTPAERGDPNSLWILLAKRLAYRYCIFANTYDTEPDGSPGGSSGISELPGNDFMVTLGSFNGGGTPDEQAGTFMHEFGHTLGLLHGGGDSINYKPNFYSIMNYAWQVRAPYNSPWWKLDYSRNRLRTLNEAELYEGDGVGGPTGTGVRLPYGVARPPGFAPQIFTVPMGAGQIADWNRNGALNLDPYAMDLNGWGWGNSPDEVLHGWCDWDNLVYGIRGSRNFLDGVHARDTANDELTAAQRIVLETIPLLLAGDLNCDGAVNNFDIDAFVLALVDPSGYAAAFPNCSIANGDVNGDGAMNNFDIDPFVQCILNGCP